MNIKIFILALIMVVVGITGLYLFTYKPSCIFGPVVEDIGNELEKTDLIRISSPRPNQLVESPLEISGEARGYWFFEADFPIRLMDSDGNQLGVAIAAAQSSWMTEEFIQFQATLEFEVPSTNKGTLILEKDNPSGLPENEDELIVPIRFQ